MFSFSPNSDMRSQLEKELDNIRFKEPLSDHTKKTRRNLIVFALLGILLGTFKFKINSFFGLGFTQESVPPDILLGVLFSLNLYCLCSFFLYLSSDIITWNFEDQRIKTLQYDNVAKLASAKYVEIESSFKNMSAKLADLFENKEFDSDELRKTVNLLFENHRVMTANLLNVNGRMQTQLDVLENSLKTIRKVNIRFYLRIFWLAAIDIFIPVYLGTTAILKTYNGIGNFFTKLFLT